MIKDSDLQISRKLSILYRYFNNDTIAAHKAVREYDEGAYKIMTDWLNQKKE